MKNSRHEIGSEFWNIPVCKEKNNLFSQNTQWFLSGRSALYAIIKDIKLYKEVKTAVLPSWCCDSMIMPFLQENIEVFFYDVIISNNQLIQNINIEADILLVLDYFGFSSTMDYSNYSGIVIRDLTHCIISNKHCDADYYFGSMRKWAGFFTGGFAWSSKAFIISNELDVANINYLQLRNKAMCQKKDYINGFTHNKDFLKIFEQAELFLEDNILLQQGTERDKQAALTLDISYISKRRRSNANILMNRLSDYIIFDKLKDEDCPLFVPVIIENRDEIKKHMINNQIYCPIHWPITKIHKLNEKTIEIYKKEMSIICDQRYDENDMHIICDIFLKGVKNVKNIYVGKNGRMG